MSETSADKAALRRRLRAARHAHAAYAGDDAAAVLAQALPALLRGCGVEPPAVVAAYMPLSDEINPLVAVRVLHAQGYRIVMPVTQGRVEPLLFRLYDETTPMQRSAFGVMEPVAGEAVEPDAFCVPLLAFDDACHRLGYGAGHYDCTLEQARATRDVLVVGVAFDMQHVPLLHVEEHDQPLDCIVTEKGIYWPQTKADNGEEG